MLPSIAAPDPLDGLLPCQISHLIDATFETRCWSLSTAAYGARRDRRISQSTLSRRVQSLERRLGLAGGQFLRDAKFGAEHLRRVVGEISFVRKALVGELRIGVMASLAQGPLADLLTAFRERFPKIDVRISEGSSQAHAVAVLKGRLDAAFIVGEPRLPSCDTTQLCDETLFAALPSNHNLAAHSCLSWEDLRGETLLVMADGSGPEMEGVIIRCLSTLGFRPKIAVQNVGRDGLLNIVGKGYGLTLVANSILGAAYPGIRFVPIEPAEIISWSLLWPRNNPNPALKCKLELSVAKVSSPLPTVA